MIKDINLLRTIASELVKSAFNYQDNISRTDPKYLEIVENRDVKEIWKSYSSCADLAHWLYFRLGVRENWINRKEYLGWKPGINVSNLAWKTPAKTPDKSWKPEAGDVCIIWNKLEGTDAHVMIVLELKDGNLTTANFGNSGMSLGTIGAAIKTKPLNLSNGKWNYGGKIVQRSISLIDILPLLKIKPNVEGAKLSGEIVDALDN